MKKESRLLYRGRIKNTDKKWYEFWKDVYVYNKHILRVNKKGEVVLGKILKDRKKWQ